MVILETTNLTKLFGGLRAVDNVSLQVFEGEVLGIIGPNGAGKTTFFNLCTGTFQRTSGQVLFKGKDISTRRPNEIAEMGLVRTFQNLKLFTEMTVLENIIAGFHVKTKSNIADAIFHTKRYRAENHQTSQKATEILEKLGLAQFKDAKASELPYGTQRKVEIARALALEPTILMLDEPAAGMNPNETQDLLRFIKMLNGQGQTIVVIEHDMKFIMNVCDRIAVLVYGKKIAQGKPREIKENRQVQEAYFGSGMFLSPTDAGEGGTQNAVD